MAAYSVILCEDSSSTLWIRPLFSLLWFYPLFQGRFVYPDYGRFFSIVLVWIRPLLLIKLGFMAAFAVVLFEDSSSTLWIRPLFSLLWYYPLFQGRFVYPDYGRFFSIVLVWIRPLLLIKLGFMAAFAVVLFEDSSSTLWIRPLFSLLWFYPLSQGRFVYPDYRRFVSIVFVWIRPLWLIKLGLMAFINLHLDLFWHKKEAAASTVCVTGFPCHFFWFFP